jgi:hypothetical protein
MQEFIPIHDKYMYKNGTTGEKSTLEQLKVIRPM